MPITQEGIFNAADALAERGERPTLAKIREAVGGGSYTTISQAMDAWRLQREAVEEAQRVPIPDAILAGHQNLLAQVWNAAQDAAAARLENERRAFADARARDEAEKREAVQAADELMEQLDTARAERDAAATAKAELEDRVTALAKDSEKGRDLAARLLNECTKTTKDLEAALGEAKVAQEKSSHLEGELASQKVAIRELHEKLATANQGVGRLNEIRRTLEKTETLASERGQRIDELKRQLRDAEQALAQARQENRKLQDASKELEAPPPVGN